MSKSYHKKNQYFLDVAQYIISQPYQGTPSPKVDPSPYDFNDIKTPHNLPFMIEFEGNRPSPYLNQLMKNPQIQFYDFTLQGPQQSDFEEDEYKYLDNDAIIQEDEQNQKSDYNENNYYEEQLPYIESSRLNLKTFRAILQQFKNIKLTDQQVRQFVQEYLTQENLQNAKQKTNQQLIQMAQYNLRPCGLISWLQRRNKVSRYLMKKKRRIWNKKINYDCRKKVAENRLRIKGKFVTQEQACQLLGIDDKCNIDRIKELLEQKYRG